MVAMITLLTGLVIDMSLRDIILQEMRGKITELILLMTKIGTGTVRVIWRTILRKMNIASFLSFISTDRNGHGLAHCQGSKPPFEEVMHLLRNMDTRLGNVEIRLDDLTTQLQFVEADRGSPIPRYADGKDYRFGPPLGEATKEGIVWWGR